MVIADTLIGALLVLLAPASGAVLCILFGRGQAPAWVATAALFLSWSAALLVFAQVSQGQTVDENLFVWLRLGDPTFSCGVLVDGLTAILLVATTTLAFAIQLFSVGTRKRDSSGARFFSLVCLASTSVTLLLIANNLGLLYGGWVLLGISGYFLTTCGRERPEPETRSGQLLTLSHGTSAEGGAFGFWAVDRVGDLAFLLSILMLASVGGTLEYKGLPTAGSTSWTQLAGLLLLFAVFCRSGQFPFHVWLSNATRAPASTNALVHFGFMSIAAVYTLLRVGVLLEQSPSLRWMLIGVGLTTAIFSGLIALGERDLKKVLAFSSSSQMGLVLAVVGMGAHAVAILYVCLHACLKALLFLSTSVLSARSNHNLDVWNLPQRSGRLLVPFWAFIIGITGLAGLPPSAAYWSTGAAMAAIYSVEMLHLWVVGCAALLLTALYGFRVVLLIYARPAATVQDERPKPLPHAATAALIVLSVTTIGAGLLPFLTEPQVLYRMIVPEPSVSAPYTTEFPQTIYWFVPAAVVLVGLAIAWALFGFKTAPADKENFWQVWVRNHFYVEWLSQQVILRPLRWIAGFLRDAVDTVVLDLGCVWGSAMIVRGVGWVLCATQTGRIGLYATVATAGLVATLFYFVAF